METPIHKILVADPVSPSGVEALSTGGGVEVVVNTGLKEDQLIAIIPEFSGLVVRSQTKVTAKVLAAATNLRVIGRAGVGVDNVDVPAATARGIIVMNTPGGNTISTAEHAFSLMVSTARSIPQAHASVKAGKWDRKSFEGVELYGKSLAVLGMGRIGSELSRRALAFGMRVLAYDPYLSASRARALQVELMEELETAVAQADFISLHMPLTQETRHMLDAKMIAKCKPGVRIINCARGGLVSEQALGDALRSGHVAAAALDVYEVEPPPADFPLRDLPNIVFTPHLGASTAEAQESVGIEIAEAIRACLLHGTITNAVNMPNIDARTLQLIGPYISFGEKLGRFLSQLAPKRCTELNINYSGKVNESDTTAVSRSILKGFLESAGGGDVNMVNAPAMAKNLGLIVNETRHSFTEEFTEDVEITTCNDESKVSVAGTFFGAKPRIVKINSRHVEAHPAGVLLVLENNDRPGIVGHIGKLMGDHRVNIASMSLSRSEPGGTALTVLNLDSEPPAEVMASMTSDPDIVSTRTIVL